MFCFDKPVEGGWTEEDLATHRNKSLDNAWDLLGKYGFNRGDHEGHRAPIPLHACCAC